ncbi:MAG: hypothetical protein M1832_004486, partial [Thelocarpon impressellum]
PAPVTAPAPAPVHARPTPPTPLIAPRPRAPGVTTFLARAHVHGDFRLSGYYRGLRRSSSGGRSSGTVVARQLGSDDKALVEQYLRWAQETSWRLRQAAGGVTADPQFARYTRPVRPLAPPHHRGRCLAPAVEQDDDDDDEQPWASPAEAAPAPPPPPPQTPPPHQRRPVHDGAALPTVQIFISVAGVSPSRVRVVVVPATSPSARAPAPPSTTARVRARDQASDRSSATASELALRTHLGPRRASPIRASPPFPTTWFAPGGGFPSFVARLWRKRPTAAATPAHDGEGEEEDDDDEEYVYAV